ncbi:MAG: GNAT family N-acetyltransferase [Bacillota bacterium]
MKIERLSNGRVEDFFNYCRLHKGAVDSSFLYEDDLKQFQNTEENPTYLAIDENGKVKAAASLIMDEYAKRGRKSRFRNFHSEIEDINVYKGLMDQLLKYKEGYDKYFIFIPLDNKKLQGNLSQLQFSAERYSFILLRDHSPVASVNLPENYEIKNYESGKDEKIWCMVRNSGFAKLKGSETPMSPDQVKKMMASGDCLEGGAMILYHYERPVGVVKCSDDEYDDIQTMNIGSLALIPEYQGKGLGRMLLRKALQFGFDQSYKHIYLSVNGENEQAKSLYLQEGFKEAEGFVCYSYHF